MRKILKDSTFFIFTLLCCGFMSFLLSACAQQAEKNENPEYTNVDDIIKLHEEMNAKHGKTSGYYANLALADENYDKAYALHYADCKRGSVIECLNAYYVGEERALHAYDDATYVKQLTKSIQQNIQACKQNISFGCVNVFFAFEAIDDDDTFISKAVAPNLKGLNDEVIADKAINLTKKECNNDDATSCFFHARILRVIDHYADVEYYINKGLDLGYVIAPFVRLPMQSPQTIDYFKRSCALNEALSCRYVAYWFDQYENNQARGKEFYKKACNLGLSSACEETRKPLQTRVDEIGSPIIDRR